jgi:hypothetical protein
MTSIEYTQCCIHMTIVWSILLLECFLVHGVTDRCPYCRGAFTAVAAPSRARVARAHRCWRWAPTMPHDLFQNVEHVCFTVRMLPAYVCMSREIFASQRPLARNLRASTRQRCRVVPPSSRSTRRSSQTFIVKECSRYF